MKIGAIRVKRQTQKNKCNRSRLVRVSPMKIGAVNAPTVTKAESDYI
jgi:hypothetical protein